MLNKFLIFLIALSLASCASDPIYKELNNRAKYDGDDPSKTTLGERVLYKGPKTSTFYIYPQVLSNGDRYRGGFIDVVIDSGGWEEKIEVQNE